MIKVALRLDGLDLRDLDEVERIPPEVADLSFEQDGMVCLAILYTDGPSAVAEAADSARLIHKNLEGVRVRGVHDELVSVGDIAHRCQVATEAVRLWASGRRRAAIRPFPPPRDSIGFGTAGRSMNVFAWREVVAWVRDVIGIDPDEGIEYLDDRQISHLNAEIVDLDPPLGSQWDVGSWHRVAGASVVSRTGGVEGSSLTVASATAFEVSTTVEALILEGPDSRPFISPMAVR